MRDLKAVRPKFHIRLGLGLGVALSAALIVLLQAVLAPPLPARADAKRAGLSLVMVEDPGCVYCRKWHEEVGPGYPLSDEGKTAPLVRLRLGSTALGAFKTVKYTPTFILVRDGQEVDRIVGYAGADFFWSAMAEMLEKAKPRTPPPTRGTGTVTDIRFQGASKPSH